MQDDIESFLKGAVDATVFLAPRDIGLTFAELLEVAGRAGYREGQTRDAVNRVWRQQAWGQSRFLPQYNGMAFSDFNFEWSPELRCIEAVEFAAGELRRIADEVTAAKASVARDVLVERAVQAGLSRETIESAIAGLLVDGIFEERDGLLRRPPNRWVWPLPSEQLKHYPNGNRHRLDKAPLERAYPLVEDVVRRRNDGRAPKAEPLDAFEATLVGLAQQRFVAWWVQARSELRTLSDTQQPTATIVVAAAMAEAALSFVLRPAQSAGLMSRTDVTKPRSWRFEEMANGTKSGKQDVRSMLSDRARARCLELNELRQRIHVGFLVSSNAGPIPDVRPEQAREARQTLDMMLRDILEWLESQGPSK